MKKKSESFPPTFIDVFCGAGGFTQGLKAAGWKHVVGVEIDVPAANTYAANHDGHVLVKDATQVRKADLDPFFSSSSGEKEKKLDLLACSPPCQSFSLAGGRKDDDDKDRLWRQAFRIARMYRPTWILVENVTGMLSKAVDARPAIDRVLDDLDEMGYDATYAVLNATDYEVPQSRRRVFVLAAKKSVAKLPSPDSGVFPPPPVTSFDPRVCTVLAPHRRVPEAYFFDPAKIAYYEKRAVERPGYVRFLDPQKPSPTVRASYMKSRGAEALVRVGKDRLRMLTEREVARIQTFPDDYVFSRTKGGLGGVYAQVGNAVPVNLAMHVGRALLREHHRRRRS